LFKWSFLELHKWPKFVRNYGVFLTQSDNINHALALHKYLLLFVIV